MKHKDSGIICLVAHMKEGVMQPPCIKCANCGQWVRPEDMAADCQPPKHPQPIRTDGKIEFGFTGFVPPK